MYVLVLCIIVLILVGWVHYQTEPFTTAAVPTIDLGLVNNYHTFASTYYNPFLTVWTQSIVSAMSADQPQAPLTHPGQSSSSAPTIPPQAEMNAYIANLSQKLGKPLPNITDPLPDSIDITTFPTIAPKLPTDPAPYTNALTWINTQLQDAQVKLQSALKGESFRNLEGFDNQTCQDLSQCFQSNPELAQQCAAALQTQQKKTQQQVSLQIQKFLQDKAFAAAFQLNQTLVAQSKQVQNQAQSGDLLNQMKLPKEKDITFHLPAGSDKLKNMDYAKQQQIKETTPSMFSLKSLFDQINANLR